ncbi:nicotinate (nicotinamide) nucleotide adenylyltransferase [Dysgonomonas sp. BGC7]|uniref:nicotinate (nicotinamide) nucleotide adenylyltransferase n=1 Tax=Dysgonomonas sp. BGC7 TaxID=1658008 RepID=UPI00067FEBF3|nr:nicotinate (nicotinamide) nucleotide adenylyltransferase [Dysgonomonas sp. BGC7]MBD8387517.1 nicotinate-nucleotide adenylyltransferase [Dysgonomonas sp. BGC7]
MNIGVFSGSFNPIHIGHVILGNYIVEYTDVDEVWFLVSPHNPLKEADSLLDENTRLEMVKLALRKYDKLIASDFEFSMPTPSYTIGTLDALSAKYPEQNFTLIIGGDNWEVFENWRDYDRLLQNYKLKVYPRIDSRISISGKLRNQVEALDSPIIEISSTFIRDGIKDHKDVRSFLPDGVYEYIIERKLYNK